MEPDLLKRLQRYELLEIATQDIVWDWNFAERRLWWNDNFYTFFGYDKNSTDHDLEEWKKCIHPDDRERVLTALRKLIDTGGKLWNGNYRFRKADGSYVDVLDRAYILRDKEEKPVRIVGSMQNVSAQQRADKKARYAAALMENVADAIIGTNNDFRITSWNKAAEQIFGWKPNEVLGLKISEVLVTEYATPEERDLAFKELNSFGKWRGEVRQVTKAGVYIDILAAVATVRDDHNEVIGYVSVNKDITQHKLREQILRQNETRFKAVFASVDDGIAVYDMDGNPIMINDAFAKTAGYDSGEEMQRKIGDKSKHILTGVTGAELLPETLPLKRVLRGETFSDLELRSIRKDTGKEWYLSFSGSPVFNEDGRQSLSVLVSHDISEKKKAELAYAEAESRYRLVIENIRDYAIFIVDFEGIIQTWNPGIEHILGYTENEFIGKHFGMLFTPEDVHDHAHTREIEQALTSGSAPDKRWHLRKDGTRIFCDGVATRVLDDQGKPLNIVKIMQDVTERRKVEQQLAESEERFRLILQNTSDIITAFDKDGTIVYESPSIERVLGLSPNERIGQNIFTSPIVHPEDREQKHRIMRDALANPGKIVKYEFRLRHKNGSYRNIEAVAISLLDHPHFPVVLANYRDVTERLLAEAAFREQAELNDVITRSISVGLIMVDDNHRCTFMNPAAEQITGYTLLEVQEKKQPLHNIMHYKRPDGSPYPIDECPMERASLSKEMRQGEEQMVKPDGSFYPVVYTVSPIVDEGHVRGVVIEIRDTSAEKKAQEAITEREQRFQTLADNVQILAWMANGDGWIFWYNKQWYEYTGTTFEEAEGWSWEKLNHPDHSARVSAFIRAALKKGEPWELTYPLRARDGSYRWFLTRAFPIKDNTGKVTRWIGTNTDIDEQKAANEKLEALIAERTKALQRSNEDLQQFAHVASHDLKEPVRKIKTFLNLIQSDYYDNLPDEGKLFFEKIQTSVDRLKAMIEGVLAYSMMSNVRREKEPVDLNVLIDNLASDLEVMIEQKHAVIEHDNLPHVEGTEILLYQLFYNLVYNALKFARPGEPCKIQLRSKIISRRNKQYAVIDVIDNGIGFEPEDAEKIFTTFVRLHSKDKYEGTGLGLALCKKIAERHHGSIHAKGELGKGAIFTVTLPVKLVEKTI